MTKTQKRTRYIAVTAMLSAIATVLMYIEIVCRSCHPSSSWIFRTFRH